jgi:hypothetical protein
MLETLRHVVAVELLRGGWRSTVEGLGDGEDGVRDGLVALAVAVDGAVAAC